jgi:hypothetical protein
VIDVAGSNDTEVPSVERGDLLHTESFGHGHNGRVHGSERLVPVAPDELGRPLVVLGQEVNATQVAQSEELKERCFRLGAESRLQHVASLGDHRRWNDEVIAALLAQLLASPMIDVGRKGDGYERPSVDKDH